jgi:hypothetical protein
MGHWRHLLERAEEMEVDVNRCSARKVCGVWGAGFEDWRTWLRLSLLVRKWNAGLEEVVDGFLAAENTLERWNAEGTVIQFGI